MSNIATLETTSNALDTTAKFLRLVGNEGVTMEQLRLPIDNVAARRNLAAFFKNGCQFVVKGPGALLVDRATPFDPVKFISDGWEIVEEDKNALKLDSIDFSKVHFESGLKEGEQTIDGEEKLKRLKRLGIRLDAKCGQALYEEKGQATLRWLYDTHGVTWFELSGTVLRDSDGGRCFLCLHQRVVGSWDCRCYWLDGGRRRDSVSPLLAS